MQPVLIQLFGCTLHSDIGDNLSSDIGGTGRLSKVNSSKLKKLIQPSLIRLVDCTLRSDNG